MLLVTPRHADVLVATRACMEMLRQRGERLVDVTPPLGIWLGDPDAPPLPYLTAQTAESAPRADDRVFVQSSSGCGAWSLLRLCHALDDYVTSGRDLQRRRLLATLQRQPLPSAAHTFIPLLDLRSGDSLQTLPQLQSTYAPVVSKLWIDSREVTLPRQRCS